jgi:C1A family cysteine protease
MKRWLKGIDYYSSIEEGYTPPIKDQGDCGSCVAFGVVAAIEIQYRKKYGEFVNLSEGDLYFCSGYRTCGTGWLIPLGLDAAKNGVAYESERPYRDSDDAGYAVCYLDTHHLIGVQTHQHLVDIDMIQEAIVRDGAVVASLAIYEDFYSYGGGVYYHSWGELCGFHCVTIVGYNDRAGYWICRNSWGSHWGMSGYFSIGYLECGIDDDIHSLEIFKLS